MVATSRDIKEEFNKYAGGDTELAIMHVCLFKSILEKYNFCKEQESAQLLLNNLQKEFDKLNMYASAHGKKLMQHLNKARKEVKAYIDTAFKYFHHFLDESFVLAGKVGNMLATCWQQGKMSPIFVQTCQFW